MYIYMTVYNICTYPSRIYTYMQNKCAEYIHLYIYIYIYYGECTFAKYIFANLLIDMLYLHTVLPTYAAPRGLQLHDGCTSARAAPPQHHLCHHSGSQSQSGRNFTGKLYLLRYMRLLQNRQFIYIKHKFKLRV